LTGKKKTEAGGGGPGFGKRKQTNLNGGTNFVLKGRGTGGGKSRDERSVGLEKRITF